MPEADSTLTKPDVLHKYRTDSEYTEKLISDRQVFLATAEQLNDPFECTLQDVSREWAVGQVEDRMQAALEGFALSARTAATPGRRFFGLRPAQAEKAVARILSGGDLNKSYEAMREFVRKRTGRPPSDCREMFARMDDQLLRVGIFSLSAVADQPLMWAHYSGDHTGLCLGFRAEPGSKLADPAHCLPVIYSDELPTMPEAGLRLEVTARVGVNGVLTDQVVALDDPTFQRVVTTKPTDWSYENEYRYVERTGGLWPWPGELAECTFGLRCAEERRRRYVELIKRHAPNEVRLFEMRKVRGSNRLERIPYAQPIAYGRGESPPAPVANGGTAGAGALDWDTFAARMQALLAAGDYDEIILQTGTNLIRYPRNPALHAMKAQAHGFARDHQKSYKHFRRLSQLMPESADGWYGMGVALTHMGRPKEAIVPLRRAYEIDPNDRSHALNLGIHLIEHAGLVEEGLACLRQADRLGHRRAGRIIDEVEDGLRRLSANDPGLV